MWKRLVAGTCLVAAQAEFQFEARHTCGVCRDIEDGQPCERYGACHVVNTSTWVGCDSFCRVSESSSSSAFLHVSKAHAAEPALDVRVAKAFGTKEYDVVRISVISNTAAPPVPGFFEHSAQFKYKWTDNYLHTSLKKVQPGGATTFDLGQSISIALPAQGAGVAGLLVADPCVSAPGMWIGCAFGDKYKTMQRTPELISTFASDKDTNFWGILGDNFYDRTGETTKSLFSAISPTAKSKIFVSVPGNHDYWVLGSPLAASDKDQCGNGFMQFYGQDSKAAERISIGDTNPPFDFSVDPHKAAGCEVAAMNNFFWYHQVGNVGMIGQSGAYTLDQAMPFMKESCSWLSSQPGVQVVLLYGHWDKSGLGAEDEMAMPQWYQEMAKLPGCAAFHQRGMLKFVMGHTHCNDPHPYGNVGAGFRVAGFGMDGGCGNYGAPIVDTTGGRVRFWYFDLSTDDKYSSVIACVQQKGWRGCSSMAALWLDEPINTTTPTERIVV